jgi:hypothetical protein
MKLLNVPISEKRLSESLSGLQRQAQPESFTVRAFPILSPQIGLVTVQSTVQNRKTASNQNGIGLERVNGIHEVEGSIPFSSTKKVLSFSNRANGLFLKAKNFSKCIFGTRREFTR